MNTGNLKVMVRGFYDLQKLRIQMGNRIVGNFKAKLGQEPGHSEDELDSEGKEILKKLRASYTLITDGVKAFPSEKKFSANGVISTYTELCLLDEYVSLEQQEAKAVKHIKAVLVEYPIWNAFLLGVRGVGPAMGGVIISEIDISKAKYPSSLWAYTGLDVASDGRGRSRKQDHLVEKEYTNKDGEQATRKGITFNPFLKTKMIGVLAGSFLKAGGPYEQIYRDYKNRLESRPDLEEESKGHRHNMALRYMVKMFLLDLHREWRALEGYEPTPPYHEAKLGMKHSGAVL